MSSRNENNIFYGVDRITVLIYILLVVMGWLNIYAAVFNEDHRSIFDTSQKYGKQLIWIGGATIIAFSILLIDANFYTAFAYFFYGFFLVANVLVIFLGRDVKEVLPRQETQVLYTTSRPLALLLGFDIDMRRLKKKKTAEEE